MRRNFAQALVPTEPFDHNNPPSVASRKPYPNFNVFINSDWSGSSSYHSGNVKLEHRAGRLLFTTAYTWAKSIDNKSAAAPALAARIRAGRDSSTTTMRSSSTRARISMWTIACFQLRLQPALWPGRKVSFQRQQGCGFGCRRLAVEWHCYFPEGFPILDLC